MKNPRLALAALLTLASGGRRSRPVTAKCERAAARSGNLAGSLVPNSAFFLGLSASANWTSLISVTNMSTR
jgi:hypothetical protein